MIVYIASYPRSGNFFLQTLLGNQFKRPTTIMHHPENEREIILKRWSNHNKRYFDIDTFEDPQADLSGYGELAPWIVFSTSSGQDKPNKALIPGCVKLIRKPKIREFLAKDSEYYFIKTHLFPDAEFYPGEYVIQAVRNAGACLWSYYNHGKDMRGKTTGLTETIEKGSGHGVWSDYHEKWLKAADQLGPRYLQIRYEDLVNREIEFCERLQTFLSLPIISREVKPFDFYHKLRPVLARKGKVSGWEENFSKKQMKILWEVHGNMMTHLGYPEPNYELGRDEDIY